ncbi:MAG: hypothetical protein AAF961_15185, partial [Planctomycetota bacterium]
VTTEVNSADILMVVGDESSPADDEIAERDYLVNTRGHTVTYIDDSASGEDTLAAADLNDALIVSASVGSGNIGSGLFDYSGGILTFESFHWDDMQMTVAFGQVDASTDIQIDDPSSYGAAGLSGIVTVYDDDGAGAIAYRGGLADEANLIASLDIGGGDFQPAAFGIARALRWWTALAPRELAWGPS